MRSPVGGDKKKSRLKLEPVPRIVVYEPAVQFDTQARAAWEQVNSLAVILGRCICVEFRVKSPPCHRLAEEQTGGIVAIEVVFIQRVAVDVTEADIARNVQWKARP